MPRKKIDPSSSYPDVIGDVRFNKKYVLSMINKPSAGGCWTWNGGKHRQGYGMVSGRRVSDATRVMMTVHRLMLKIKLGRDLGAHVDAVHTCGNSECVNPSHLVEGDAKMLTQLQILRYGRIGGRPKGSVGRGPRKQNYKYTPDHLRNLLRDTISLQQFASIYNIPLWRARSIKRTISNGSRYPWARRELKLEQEKAAAGL